MNKTKFQHFFVSPNEIFDFEKSDLSVYAKIVYLYICRCENNSTAFPSFQTIGKKCSISKSTAQKAVDELIAAGLIIKDSGVSKGNYGENKSNTYITVDPINKIGIPSHGTPIPSHNIGIPSDGNNKRTIDIRTNNKELNIYIISEENDVFSYYSQKFKAKFGKEHPTMNKEKIIELVSNYYELSSELNISNEQWIELVDFHFDNLSPKNNGNILSFLTLNGESGCVYRYKQDLENYISDDDQDLLPLKNKSRLSASAINWDNI